MLIMQTATQNTAEPVLKISNYRKKLSHRIQLERWNPYDNTSTCHTCFVSIVDSRLGVLVFFVGGTLMVLLVECQIKC